MTDSQAPPTAPPGLPQSPTATSGSDLRLLAAAAGIVAWLAACLGAVYLASGEILEGEGFKGILLGSFLGLVVSGAGVALSNLLARVLGPRVGSLLAALALCGSALVHARSTVLPLLQREPTGFYGAPDSTYVETYSDGRTRETSGAELGRKRWEFPAGAHTAATLAAAFGAIFLLYAALFPRRHMPSSEVAPR